MMTMRPAILSTVFVVTLCRGGMLLPAESHPGRILEGKPQDARLGGAVTLDAYHPWEPPEDPEAWKARRVRTRRQILVAAGLWPMPPKTELKPVIHGRIDRGDYTVEKAWFQSHPGFYVTGNLYRPKGRTGRCPGVLCPHGHWSNGRFYERSEADAQKQIEGGKEKGMPGARYPLQARCVQLARMGCVVFHYDMVGYADSKQIGHASGFGDVEAELHLQSAFGLQTWNSIRALDFISGLPDVDPERIGVTGASGGGTQTFILCAVDDRPAAAFPAVMVSTDMQGGCVCENASHLRVGTSNIEFAALAAPRPYGMTGADDWTREILTKGLPELKAVWKAHGKEDLVEAWCYPKFEHNYNQVSREHMYAWFNWHLGLGLEEPIQERPFEPVPPAELSVFDEEHPRPGDAVDAAKLREHLTAVSDREIASLVPRDASSLAEFRRVIGGALETILHTTLPGKGEIEARELGEADVSGHRMGKLLLGRKGSGEAVPAIILRPQEWNGTVVVVVIDLGKREACFVPDGDDLRQEVKAVLARGAAVLSPDVFLTGEYLDKEGPFVRKQGADLEGFPKDAKRHGRYVGYTYGYNRALLAHRVHDLLTSIGYARSLPGSKRVNLVGARHAAHWAILARALAGDAVWRVAVSPRNPLVFVEVKSLDDPSFLPGALKYGGMPFFTALCAPGELRWICRQGPGDVVRAAYQAGGKPDSLLVEEPERDGEDAIFDWISR